MKICMRFVWSMRKTCKFAPNLWQGWICRKSQKNLYLSLDQLNKSLAMSISRKRPRTSELSELEAPKEAVTSQSTTAAPTKSKSSRRRYRKRSTKSKSKAKDSGIIPPRNWTVVNTYGGRFKPTSVFSKDEKFVSGYASF
jgi:hypothetical protein